MGLLSTGAYAAVDEYPIAVELVSSGDGWVAKSSFTLPSCDERLVSGAFLLMYAVGEAEEGIRSFDVEAMVSLDSNLESLIGQVPEIQFTSRPAFGDDVRELNLDLTYAVESLDTCGQDAYILVGSLRDDAMGDCTPVFDNAEHQWMLQIVH